MKLHLPFVVFLACQVVAEDLLEEFSWNSTDCAYSGYDYCGTLKFCEGGDQTYGYRQDDGTCRSPGPTFVMEKGKNYLLVMQNEASVDSNLHTHGLHLPGHGNSDDIYRVVAAGNCLAYSWEIPADHAEGTFWYHAHHHGTTEEQVAGGAVGMIIISDDPDSLLPDDGSLTTQNKADITAWLANEKSIMIMQIGTGGGGGGPPPPPGKRRKRQGVTFYANGVTQAGIDLISGEWYRVRVAVSDPDSTGGDLTVDDTNCEVHFVAFDGVFRSSVPGTATSSMEITGASRRDLAIKCTGVGNTAAMSFDGQGGGNNVVQFTVITGTTTSADPAPSGNWSPVRPTYLADLTSASVDNTFGPININPTSINGVTFSADTPLTTIVHDTVQEWSTANSDTHPFHLHVWHMQVVTSGGCGDFLEGEWYDVIGEPCTVRFKTVDYGGRTIFHCHILAHEDDGAMGWANVTGGPVQSSVDPPTAEYNCATGAEITTTTSPASSPTPSDDSSLASLTTTL